MHTCTATDGTPIREGAIFLNNDLKPVKVVAFASRDWREGITDMEDLKTCAGARGNDLSSRDHCWWKCERPDGSPAGSFDGTRLAAEARTLNRGTLLAQDEWEAAGGS